MSHTANWLINKGRQSPPEELFSWQTGAATPPGAQYRPLLGRSAPLGLYNKMNSFYIVSKLPNCPSGGLAQPSPVAARLPWPTIKDCGGVWVPQAPFAWLKGVGGGFPLRGFRSTLNALRSTTNQISFTRNRFRRTLRLASPGAAFDIVIRRIYESPGFSG